MTKSKKAFYNITSQAGYEVVAAVCGIILPKLIIKQYGSECNGLISAIGQFLSYVNILNLGLAGSTRVALYQAFAKDDIYAVSSVLRAHRDYMRKVGTIFTVYALLLAVAFPFIRNGGLSWIQVFALVIIISFGKMAEYLFGTTAKTFLAAKQSTYIKSVVYTITKIASTVVAIVIILNDGSLFLMKICSTLCIVMCPLTINYYTYKKYEIVRDVEPDPNALKNRKDVAASSIANIVHDKVDIFTLTLFTDLKTVSIYTVYMLIIDALRKLQEIFTMGLEGAFGSYWAKGETENFRKKLQVYEHLIYMFILIVFSCALNLILPFMELYIKGVKDANYIVPTFATLAIIATAVFSLRTPYLTAVQAAGKYKETRNGAIAEAVINLVLSMLCVIKWGLVGVTVGTLAANLFRTIQYSIYTYKELIHRSYMIVVKKVIWLIVNMLIILSAQRFAMSFIDDSSWLMWIVNGFVTVIISIFITYVSSLIFYKEELGEVVKIVSKMVPGRKK